MKDFRDLTIEELEERLEIVEREPSHFSYLGYERKTGEHERFFILKHDDGTMERTPSRNVIDDFEDGFNLIGRDKLTGELYEFYGNIYRRIYRKDYGSRWVVETTSSDFTDIVWQNQDDSLTSDQLNHVLDKWRRMIDDLAECLEEEMPTEEILRKIGWDCYPLGDLSNFLANVRIRVKEEE